MIKAIFEINIALELRKKSLDITSVGNAKRLSCDENVWATFAMKKFLKKGLKYLN